jgi:hypothetical protein
MAGRMRTLYDKAGNVVKVASGAVVSGVKKGTVTAKKGASAVARDVKSAKKEFSNRGKPADTKKTSRSVAAKKKTAQEAKRGRRYIAGAAGGVAATGVGVDVSKKKKSSSSKK